jgi:hypothetical protein
VGVDVAEDFGPAELAERREEVVAGLLGVREDLQNARLVVGALLAESSDFYGLFRCNIRRPKNLIDEFLVILGRLLLRFSYGQRNNQRIFFFSSSSFVSSLT